MSSSPAAAEILDDLSAIDNTGTNRRSRKVIPHAQCDTPETLAPYRRGIVQSESGIAAKLNTMSQQEQTDIDAAIATLNHLASVSDVAAVLGVKPGTVYQHLHAGVQWVREPAPIAGRLYWQRSDPDELLDKRRPVGRPRRVKPAE